MRLSKSTFIALSQCRHNAWYRVNDRALFNTYIGPEVQDLLRVGNEIDELARDRYPRGLLLGRGQRRETMEAVERREPAIFQAEFVTEKFVVLTDILVWDQQAQAYDIIEVKSSTTSSSQRNDEYALDLAFQKFVLRSCGIPVGKTYLMRLNADYVRRGPLELGELLQPDDFGQKVDDVLQTLEGAIVDAHSWINAKAPPQGPCSCAMGTKANRCEMFEYINPNIPAYSIYDIARLGAPKIASLVGMGIFDISLVPDDFPMSERQARQVQVAKTGQAAVDHAAIRDFLGAITFPAAFLDFETHNPALPRFDGYRPYQHIPFQFSLDVARVWGGRLEHHEFLHIAGTEPDNLFMEALLAALPKTGSVVVWNKAFETTRLKEIALRHPVYAGAVENIEARVVDLADVFSLQLYVDPRFKGSYSIKKVLPVLVPNLSYGDLAVQEGSQAQREWDNIVMGRHDPAKAQELAQALLAYCALDTRAMVEIAWQLRSIVKL